MAKHNFGVIKATFTNYLNESENLLAKEQFGKFMRLMKESAFLRTIHKFYTNLEEKYIVNENLAIKYIDDNINMLKSDIILPTQYDKTTNGLQSLVEGLNIKVSPRRIELYGHINTLIEESIKLKNVDKLHESFTFILEHIKNNKPKISESALIGYEQIPKEFLVRKSIEKFNERFTSMNESDKNILKSIVSSDVNEKQRVFSSLKEDAISNLKESLNEVDIDKDALNECVTKIEKMEFNIENYTKDVLSLHELKNDITQ